MPHIHFHKRGEGKTLMLLHGFPMSSGVWDEFAEALSENYEVITPDLPGLGKSELLAESFSIEEIADAMLQWLKEQNIKKSFLVGHSLGGYIALAMVYKRPDIFEGLVLFHSTAYADTEEKKQSRNKVLKFIEDNGVETFTGNFIQPLFFQSNHPAIQKVRSLAVQSSKDAVVAYTKAMRDRPDRTDVISNYAKPILFIGGVKDGGIPPESLATQAALNSKAQLYLLEDVAHMGMFEKNVETLTIVKSFLQ